MICVGWPIECSTAPPRAEGWFDGRNRDFLSCYVGPGDVVVEIGAWMGLSTLWLADRVGPTGHVWTIDHFQGSREHKIEPRYAEQLPTLWDTFVANCWNARDRITPVRADSRAGLLHLHERSLVPTVVYVDGAHDYDTVVRDLLLSAFIWPQARIVGDDFEMADVMRAAFDTSKILRRRLLGNKRCFTFGDAE